MSKKLKRFGSLFLALVLAISMLPISVFAAEIETDDVAKIGDQGYATLQAALDVGGNITLLADINENVTVNKAVTINGAGFKFVGKMTIAGNAGVTETVTINNVKFLADTAVGNSVIVDLQRYAEAAFNDCDFTSNSTAQYYNSYKGIAVANDCSVEIKNCTASKLYYMIHIAQGSAKLVVEDCTLTDMVYGVGAFKCESVTVKDFTYNGMAAGINVKNSASTLALENVNITTTMNGQAPVAMWAPDSGVAAVKYTITLKGENVANGAAMTKANEADWFIRQNEANPYEIIDLSPKAVKIGETGYATLAEAIAAAKEGDTITFLADINENVTVDKAVTINGAGFKFVGKMTIAGNANVTETVTINNVKFLADTTVGNSVIVDLQRYAEATFEGCDFTSNSSDTYYNSYKGITVANDCTVTIKNCTASKLYYMIHIAQGSTKLVVEDSTLTDMVYGVGAFKCTSVVIKNFTYNGMAAGINVKNSASTLALENVNITTTMNGQAPVAMWAPDSGVAAVKYTITLKGENVANGAAMTKANEADWFIRQNESNPYEIVDLNRQPSGHVAYRADVTDKADREGIAILLKEVYAKKSVVVKVYNNDTLMFVCTRRDIDDEGKVMFPVDGNTTANIVLSGREAGSWINKIHVTPSERNVPNKIEVYADGVLVDTYTHESGTILGTNLSKYLALDCVKKAAAQVGETKYMTLAEAIKAATAGAEITLLADVTEDVTVDKAVTINGNDKNYTGTMTLAKTNATINLNNINFIEGYVASSKGAIKGSYINVTNCDFDGTGYYGLSIREVQNLTVENCTAKNFSYGFIYVPSAHNTNVVVKNTTIENVDLYGVAVTSGCAVDLTNVTIKNSLRGIYIADTAVKSSTLDNCTFENVTHAIAVSGGGKTYTVNFVGNNKMEGALPTAQNVKYTLAAGATLTAPEGLNITTVADYKVVYTAGVYTSVQKVYVAQIGETKYESFAEAVEAATAGDTITVLTTIKVTEDTTLNLKDITVKADESCTYDIFDVRNGATLTINDGTFDSTASPDGYTIYIGNNKATRSGNVVINGGTFVSRCTVAYVACGSLTINGGNFSIVEKDNNDYKYVINCYDANYKNGTATVTIKGGTFANFNPANNAAESANTNFTAFGYRADKNEDGSYTVAFGTAQYAGKYYATLAEAVAAAENAEKAKYVYLLCDAEGEGIVIDKNINIVLNGFTYTFIGDAVGSANTKTNGFQILKGHKVSISNGTLKVADSAKDKYAMLIQNYSDLTLRNIVLDGTNLDRANVSYVLSINCGNVVIANSVTIIANDRNLEGDYAIDVYDYSSAGYALPTLELGSKAVVEGKIYAAAKSGKIYYATLQQAIDAQQYVDLVCDYEGPGVVINKDLGLNLAGYTFTITEGVGSANTKTNGFQIMAGNKVSLRSGTIKVADSAKDKIAILIQNYADLTVSDVTLDGKNLDRASVSYVLSINSGNVKVNAGTKIISNDRNGANDWAIDVYDYSAAGYALPVVQITTDVTVNGVKAQESDKIQAIRYSTYYYGNLQQVIDKHGTATLMSDFEGAGVVFNKNATIYFEGHTYTFTSGVGSNGTESNGFQILAGNRLSLVNGALKVADSAASKFYILVQNYGDLSLKSMTLDGTNLDKWAKHEDQVVNGDSYTLSNNSGEITIDANTTIIANNDGDKAFAFDVCAYANYELPLVKLYAGATIEGKIEAAAMLYHDGAAYARYYATLEQALADRNNASSDDVLVLVNDIVLKDTLVIPNCKAIVLDLNGHTISQEKACTGHYAMIVNNHKSLTIMDSVGGGKITFKDTGKGDANFGWGSYTIENNGQLILLSGTIENATELNTAEKNVHMYCAIQQNNAAAHTQIKGGVVSTPTYRSIRINKGNLTITDGVLDGQVWIQPFADGIKVNINGGSFSPNGGDSSSIYVENSSKTVTFRVNGGSFEGKIGCANATALKGAIRSGEFTDAAYENTNEALFHKTFVR